MGKGGFLRIERCGIGQARCKERVLTVESEDRGQKLEEGIGSLSCMEFCRSHEAWPAAGLRPRSNEAHRPSRMRDLTALHQRSLRSAYHRKYNNLMSWVPYRPGRDDVRIGLFQKSGVCLTGNTECSFLAPEAYRNSAEGGTTPLRLALCTLRPALMMHSPPRAFDSAPMRRTAIARMTAHSQPMQRGGIKKPSSCGEGFLRSIISCTLCRLS